MGHQQKQILFAFESKGIHRGQVVDPSEGEVQQGLEIKILGGLRCLEGLDEIAEFRIE